MRHLGSLIAGILIAPVAWLLIALGQQKSTTLVAGWVADNRFDTVDLIAPTAYLVGAGVLLGLVATLRVSPLGPLVAGLALLAPTVSLFLAPLSTLDRMPHSVSLGSLHIDPRVPLVNGTLTVIGVLLVVAVFSAKRWRRWPVLATGTADAVEPVEPVEPLVDEPVSPYAPGFGGAPAEQPTTVASGWPETSTYTVPPVPEPAYGEPTSAYVPTPPADTTVTAPWVAPAQRSGTQVTSGVSDHESEPPPLPSRAAGGRPSPRPRHAASGTGEFPTLAQVGPVDRLAEAQRHAAAQTAAAGAAYQAQFEAPSTDVAQPGVAQPDVVVTEADQQAIAEANRRTLAEAQAEASRRAAAELQAEAERREQAETQRRAQARAQAEAQREAEATRTPPWPSPAPTSPARTETYWPADAEPTAAEVDEAATTRLPDAPPAEPTGGLRPEFTQPTSPAPAQPTETGPVWPAEDPDQQSPDDDETRAAQAEQERAAAQAEAERRAALLAEAERRAQERVRNPGGDEPPASPWSAPPRSR